MGSAITCDFSSGYLGSSFIGTASNQMSEKLTIPHSVHKKFKPFDHECNGLYNPFFAEPLYEDTYPEPVKYIIQPHDVEKFCQEHGLKEYLTTYLNEASRIFSNVDMELKLVEDPEIEDDIKVNLIVKTNNDFEKIFEWDEEFFHAIYDLIPSSRIRHYFIKTFQIVE